MEKAEALTFLRGHDLATLSTVNPGGFPESATIFYHIDPLFHFFFVTRNGTRKFQNIQENPQVALAITDPISLITIQVEGKAEIAKNSHEIKETLVALAEKSYKHELFWLPPVSKLAGSTFVVMKIKTQWLRVGDFRKKATASSFDNDYFKVVIPIQP